MNNREVWAIINVTPDSFYSGSRATSSQQIVDSAAKAIEQGADRLDIGAFSTRPSHQMVSETEELRRLDFALCAIKKEFADFPLSIDTFRSSVVEHLCESFGRFAVNDVQAGVLDRAMYHTVGRLSLPYVMMSNHSTMEVMTDFFNHQLAIAHQDGVEQIWVDPGFGFGKTTQQNFTILRQLERLELTNHPILIGISRKSMIWQTLDTTADQSLTGTTALHWAALTNGAAALRVHDTLAAKQTIKLYEIYTDYTACTCC